MTSLSALWLPILLSAVAVFILSSVIHMALPWHKGDYPGLPDEDRAMDALRPLAIPPGDYMMPRPRRGAEMRSPEFLEKRRKGPVMIMTVIPNGVTSMARNLILWFLFSLVVGALAAYTAGHALPPGAPWRGVFRFVGLTTFIAYAVGLWPMSIWYWRAWRSTLAGTLDGVIYGVLTAAIFCWLWPR